MITGIVFIRRKWHYSFKGGAYNLGTGAGKRASFSVKDLDFERERLLNLIGAWLRRKDFENARKIAEELFQVEIEFILQGKIRRIKRYNRFLFRTIFLLLPVFIASMVFAVLDFRPSHSISVLAISMLFIVSFIMISAVVVRRFEKAFVSILDGYEDRKARFAERLIRDLSDTSLSQEEQVTICLAKMKNDIGMWLAESKK